MDRLQNINLPQLSESQQQVLLSPLTEFEIESALFQMNPHKSPGPDGGLPALFLRSAQLLII